MQLNFHGISQNIFHSGPVTQFASSLFPLSSEKLKKAAAATEIPLETSRGLKNYHLTDEEQSFNIIQLFHYQKLPRWRTLNEMTQ